MKTQASYLTSQSISQIPFQSISKDVREQIQSDSPVSCSTASTPLFFDVSPQKMKLNKSEQFSSFKELDNTKILPLNDKEQTLMLNLDMITQIIGDNSEVEDLLSKIISKIFEKRELHKQLTYVKGKALIDKQIHLQQLRRNEETKQYYNEQISTIKENIAKKEGFRSSYLTKYQEVEIYVSRQCRQNIAYQRKFKGFKINEFIKDNESRLMSRKNINKEISQIQSKLKSASDINKILNEAKLQNTFEEIKLVSKAIKADDKAFLNNEILDNFKEKNKKLQSLLRASSFSVDKQKPHNFVQEMYTATTARGENITVQSDLNISGLNEMTVIFDNEWDLSGIGQSS